MELVGWLKYTQREDKMDEELNLSCPDCGSKDIKEGELFCPTCGEGGKHG